MLIPVKTSTTQIIIKGSRFLSETFIIQDQNQVRSIIKSQKNKYADSSHVCHAFILGKDAQIMGMSDDGEPGGTAGRPMLDVLKGRGVTNILVTVTRWFGGTLLGTGGLVHAYGDAVKNVLDSTEFEEYIEKSEFTLKCDYQTYQAVKKYIEGITVYDLSENFAEVVKISGKISKNLTDEFKKSIFDITNGQVEVSII